MLDHLPEVDTRQEYENNLARLNAELALESWSTPLSRKAPEVIPSEGPWWWRGEEDASQSFLASMGIQLDD